MSSPTLELSRGRGAKSPRWAHHRSQSRDRGTCDDIEKNCCPRHTHAKRNTRRHCVRSLKTCNIIFVARGTMGWCRRKNKERGIAPPTADYVSPDLSRHTRARRKWKRKRGRWSCVSSGGALVSVCADCTPLENRTALSLGARN